MAAISQAQPSAVVHSHHCKTCNNTFRYIENPPPSSWTMEMEGRKFIACFQKSDEGKNDSKKQKHHSFA